MGNLLTALNRLVGSIGGITLGDARKIRNRLALLVWILFVACIFAFTLNAQDGLKWPSLVLAVAIIAWAFWVWIDPLNLAVVAGTGVVRKITTHESLATAVREIFKVYLEDVLQWPLLVTTTFLLVTGTVSYKGSPEAILPLIVAACLIWFMIWKFPIVFQGTMGRRLIYAFAVSVVVVNVVPGSWWTKYLHWDPTMAKPTAVEESLYAFDRAERETADTDRSAGIDLLVAKKKRHEALTADEERFVAESRQQAKTKKPSTTQETAPAPAVKAPAKTICPDVTSRETRSCLITSEWSNWIKSADGVRDNGKQMCFEKKMELEKKEEGGWTFWRFKSDEGTTLQKYRVFLSCADVVF